VVVVTCRPNGSQRRSSKLQLEPRMLTEAVVKE
jgi:hypothetical protein